jgi:shikimate kinase
MHPDRILLIGYRGTGKTTVGQLLAAALGWEFVDADERIEAAAGRSIADIFAAEGEPGFRDREAAVLTELCAGDRRVIATGGGVVLRPANRELLRRSGFVAWLTGSPDALWRRTQADPTTAARRPNLTAAGGVEEVVNLLAVREPFYREVASAAFDTDTRSPEQVAADILTAWTRSSTCR